MGTVDRTSFCHSSFHGPYLHIRCLTCANAKLTSIEGAGTFRLAPSSRRDRRERAGRAAGTPQGEPNARDPGGSARIRVGPRPPEKVARPDPEGLVGNIER